MDWKNPNYVEIYEERAKRLNYLRENPREIPKLKEYYKHNIADFIDDWGMTFDPRNPERGLPSMVPFKLFPKQREWIDWVIAHWQEQENGLTEKSRDCGISWLAVAVGVSLWLFWPGLVVGYGSRKEEYVDKIGAPKSLFWKARKFIELIPSEFHPHGWNPKVHAPHMRILNPENNSALIGEAGTNIGRGDRASIYMKDESAFFEAADQIEAALSATTNCQIDMSSVNGEGNPFAIKRHSGKVDVFTFHWKDDPRKDQEWYDKQCQKFDAVIIAQEIDIDYGASKQNVLIPGAWVRAAVCFDIPEDGPTIIAFDPSDGGKDKSGLIAKRGSVIKDCKEWIPNKVDDATETAYGFALEHEASGINFDGIGIGTTARSILSNVKSSMVFNNIITSESAPKDEIFDEKRTASQAFANLRAYLCWNLRERFRKTYLMKNEGKHFPYDELISIPDNPELIRQLSMLSWMMKNGKIQIQDKAELPESPALFDCAFMAFAEIDLSEPEEEDIDIPDAVNYW